MPPVSKLLIPVIVLIVGNEDGVELGINDGALDLDGWREGEKEGARLGDDVGLTDGNPVGCELGVDDGTEEVVGSKLGCNVGLAEGAFDGPTLGIDEGFEETLGSKDIVGVEEGLLDTEGDAVGLFLLLLLLLLDL